ncbi:MAG TPA: lactate racemase domain-containing protein [Verrucomicrobiota bacterium]|nr:lactate racemase domain-containing protein [Verrucomicrobiota bacterium]HNU49914.1 lactate racemase domain-containing protein [Verrucomicrobiota bacterium]
MYPEATPTPGSGSRLLGLLATVQAPSGQALTPQAVQEAVTAACPVTDFHRQRVLLIVPDHTRTAPVGMMFKALHHHLQAVVDQFDVLIALGTHPPMSEAAILQRLEINPAERATRYAAVRFHNHEWDRPDALRQVGTLAAGEIHHLTEGRFALDVPVEVNRRLFEYDRLIIVGPVLPHEVVGFSGGNKYLFPGVAGPRILDFFHWLGAVITTPKIIGHRWTPVRRVIDRAAALIPVPKLCFSIVMEGDRFAGLFAGTAEAAWEAACGLSVELNVVVKDRPYQTILACAPAMYDEIWTAGKCMYKLEPVLADGGELIIYAPHIREFSVTHGEHIRAVGYHCRDFFVKQWDRYKDRPWGVLAHSTHVRGQGTFHRRVERLRAQVTLATAIPEAACRAVNLGYRDPASLRPEDFADREREGVLLVPKAGEVLYRLRHPPEWAA